MEFANQRKFIELDRGLFLIRYSTAEVTDRPPVVKISLDQPNDGAAALVLHPDQNDAMLWGPGATMAVRAVRSTRLAIEVMPLDHGGSAAASVRIERLTPGSAQHAVAAKPDAANLDLRNFRILGHIARIGDIVVGPQEWLAGPTAPSRIEGFSIAWPAKPQDIDIHYSVNLAKPQALSDELMPLGSFAGTRGRSLPVVGMTLEIFGRAASNYRFDAQAIFLGSPISRVTGRRVVLAGPAGSEPLVGFRLSVEHAKDGLATSEVHVGSSSGRVRVFRNRAMPVQAAAPARNFWHGRSSRDHFPFGT